MNALTCGIPSDQLKGLVARSRRHERKYQGDNLLKFPVTHL